MGKKGSSSGRKARMKAYKDSNRRLYNKIRKIKKHLKSQVNDIQASLALKRLEK